MAEGHYKGPQRTPSSMLRATESDLKATMAKLIKVDTEGKVHHIKKENVGKKQDRALNWIGEGQEEEGVENAMRLTDSKDSSKPSPCFSSFKDGDWIGVEWSGGLGSLRKSMDNTKSPEGGPASSEGAKGQRNRSLTEVAELLLFILILCISRDYIIRH